MHVAADRDRLQHRQSLATADVQVHGETGYQLYPPSLFRAEHFVADGDTKVSAHGVHAALVVQDHQVVGT